MSKLSKLVKTVDDGVVYLSTKFASELNVLDVRLDDEPDDFILYQCRECGYWTKSLGYLHGHLEKHTGFWSLADIEKFNEMTRKIVVTEYREEEVENLSEENL